MIRRFNMFEISSFISKFVTKRPESMFLGDIEANREKLTEKIEARAFLSSAVREVSEAHI